MERETGHWLKRIDRAIWTPRHALLPLWKVGALRTVRLFIVLIRDLVEGNLTLWTMSLVYTTLLSMVPLLALSFSVLKAFGVHNQVEPLLQNLLAPLGEQGQEITVRLIGFIAQMNVGVLGSAGLALLIYTVVSLIQKIEESFNAIWHVTHLRSLGDRVSRYLSVLLAGPILVFSALGITAMALNSEVARYVLALEPFSTFILVAGRVMPYVLVIGAFTFLYMFVPNARVRFAPALAAGTIGGILWQSAGWAFALFVSSSTQYAAIYSSFAILVLFLIWLYVSWLILLLGAEISFYLQHPEYLYALPGEPRLSNRMRERLALAIAGLVASHFVHGRPPWTPQQLAQQLGIPMHAVDVAVDALAGSGLLVQTGADPPAYVPARDLDQLSIAELLAIVRKAGEDKFLNPDALPVSPPITDLEARIEAAVAAALDGASVRDLVAAEPGRAAGASPPG
ncbi:MAG: YihY/virulence factor BrkB family protein [Burkholderiaceae bacterium]|nr:YihY/virulence factor BrkB family protein [Burkholderiaceae bacterium]